MISATGSTPLSARSIPTWLGRGAGFRLSTLFIWNSMAIGKITPMINSRMPASVLTFLLELPGHPCAPDAPGHLEEEGAI